MFKLMPLPYDTKALEPAMSRETLETHHGKHHKTYVEKLNKLIAGGEYADLSLEEIIHKTFEEPGSEKIFNNAAQVRNHEFFWQSMTPNGGGASDGAIAKAISASFGSFKEFSKLFTETGAEQFGSGYVWLVKAQGELRIVTTHDAETPILWGMQPLICCDVWEHAYYLDYKNERPKFLQQFLDNLVNWKFAEANLAMEGEGDHMAAARFQREQHAFAKSDKVWHAAREARQALEGAEGDDLRAAQERASRGHA